MTKNLKLILLPNWGIRMKFAAKRPKIEPRVFQAVNFPMVLPAFFAVTKGAWSKRGYVLDRNSADEIRQVKVVGR